MDSTKVLHETVRILVDSSKATVDSSKVIIDSLKQALALAGKSRMDWPTFTIELIKGLAGYAWPALVLFGLWHFRVPIRNLINRIRTIDGTKLSFADLQDANEKIAAIEVESEPIKEEVKEVTGKLIDSETKPEREQLVRELEEANKKLVELETLKKSIEKFSSIPQSVFDAHKAFNDAHFKRNQILFTIFKYMEDKLKAPLRGMKHSLFISEFEDAVAKIHSGDLESEHKLDYLDVVLLRNLGILDKEQKMLQPRGLNIVRMAVIQYDKAKKDDLI